MNERPVLGMFVFKSLNYRRLADVTAITEWRNTVEIPAECSITDISFFKLSIGFLFPFMMPIMFRNKCIK